ncbi:MAG TPA: cache domain-containing protein [Usitatibacter sp.]|nr:cache domain-containing protein [Usitatibacter sp.]
MKQRFPYLAVAGACLAIVVALWTGTAMFLAQLERAALGEAAVRRQNLARSLAEYESSSLRAMDMSLVFLRRMWRGDAEGFRESVRLLEGLLRKENVIQVAVVDARGDLVYSHLPQPVGANFRDRDYFVLHQSSGVDAIHVSAPVFGRVTQRWAIQVSRPLRDAAGRFAGLIVMAVPPPALEQVFKDIEVGRDGIITLARDDGQILARSVDFEKTVRSPLATWPEVARKGQLAGDFMGRGGVDGVSRFFSYRRLPDYGLAILVGQGADAVLAPYRRDRLYLLLVASGGTLLLLLVAGALMLRIRDKARYARQHENLILELHDGCIQAIYAAGLRLQSVRGLAATDPARAGRIIADVEADLNLVIQELRAFIGGSPRAGYTEDEFLAQLQRAIPATHRAMFSVDVEPGVAPQLAPAESEHVLRIVREAASNVARHSSARNARISLRRDERVVRLSIDDDGRGQDGEVSVDSGLGLAHIHARAKKLGGRASVQSAPGNGTKITVEFPG